MYKGISVEELGHQRLMQHHQQYLDPI